MAIKKLFAVLAAFCFLQLFACGDYFEKTVEINGSLITFDSRGGTPCAEIEAVRGAVVTLPTTAGPDSVFDGWYSNPIGGTRFGGGADRYVVEGSLTMFAHWAGHLHKDDADRVINGIICVIVEAGTFIMGSAPHEIGHYYDETQREVTISKNYCIGKYPITNSQFGRASPLGEKNHPVTNVTWQEAVDFAQRLGARLPTEAEWEFAARGGNAGKDNAHVYSGGNILNDVAWYVGNSSGKASTVGLKMPNELGIYDMSGNVFEWASDWYGFYEGDAVTDPTGAPDGHGRITRGGSFQSEARDCRVADRGYMNPLWGSEQVGFRIVFDLE